MKPHTFLFVGRSGCGKGTQKALLTSYLSQEDPTRRQFLLSTGDAFRELMERDSLTGRTVKEYLDHGRLMPVFLAVWIWSGAFIENIRGDEHIFIDGAPRLLPEAEAFDSAFKFYGREMPHVILVNVSKDAARERLMKRGRSDDDAEAIERRLDWYDTLTRPALDFFKDNLDYHFIEVDGEQPVEAVHEDILSRLKLTR